MLCKLTDWKWSPIARGVLARPWSGDSAASLRADTDITQARLLPPTDTANKTIVDIVEKVAQDRGLPMAVIGIAWCLHKGVNPIVGLSSKARMDEAFQAIKVVLTEGEIAKLEAAYIPRNIIRY